VNGQNPTLLRLIAEAAKCTPAEIVDFDLSLFDTQPASITGAFDEFVCGARLDNLISCYCGTRALVDTDSTLESDDMIRLIAFFDHEECGSSSVPGAGGSLIPDIVERILHGSNTDATRAALAARSFMLSVDGAHALHPNYPEKHQSQHRPTLHGGPVLKYHPNQRYATSGMTASVVLALGRIAGVPVQQFGVSNESPCGSTIGPILSTLTGIPTVDLGNPMLSMHSIRESCGTVDLEYLTKLLKSFFESFQTLKIQNE
jgi:aspartyl aminopeptidase